MANELNIQLAIGNKKKLVEEIASAYENAFTESFENAAKKTKKDFPISFSAQDTKKLNKILTDQTKELFGQNSIIVAQQMKSMQGDMDLLSKDLFKKDKVLREHVVGQMKESQKAISDLQEEFVTGLKFMYENGTATSKRAAEKSFNDYKSMMEQAAKLTEEAEATMVDKKSPMSRLRENAGSFWESSPVRWARNLTTAYLSWEAIKNSIVDVVNMQSKLTPGAIAAQKPLSHLYADVKGIADYNLDFDASTSIVSTFAKEGPWAATALGGMTEQIGKLSYLGTDVRDDVAAGFGAITSYAKDGGKAVAGFADSVLQIANTETRSQVFSGLVNVARTMGTQGVNWIQRAGKSFASLSDVLTGVGVSSASIRSMFTDLENTSLLEPNSPMSQLILRYSGRGSLFAVKSGDFAPAIDALAKVAEQYKSAFTMDTPQAMIQREQIQSMLDLTPAMMETVAQLANNNGVEIRKQLEISKAMKEGGKAQEDIYAKYAATDPMFAFKSLKFDFEELFKAFGEEFLVYIPEIKDTIKELIGNKGQMKEFAKSVSQIVLHIVPAITGLAKGLGYIFGGVDFLTGGDGSALIGGIKLYFGKKLFNMITGGIKFLTGGKIPGGLVPKLLNQVLGKFFLIGAGFFKAFDRAWDSAMKGGSFLSTLNHFLFGFTEGIFKTIAWIPTKLFDFIFGTDTNGLIDNMFDNAHGAIDVIFKDGMVGFFEDLWRVAKQMVRDMASDVVGMVDAAKNPSKKAEELGNAIDRSGIIGKTLTPPPMVEDFNQSMPIKKRSGVSVKLQSAFGNDLMAALQEVSKQAPGLLDKLEISSAFRERNKQILLYNAAAKKAGKPLYDPNKIGPPVGGVAYPGTSRHEKGTAIDISGLYSKSVSEAERDLFVTALNKRGIGQGQMKEPGGAERWHFERVAKPAPRPLTAAASAPSSSASQSAYAGQSADASTQLLDKMVHLLGGIFNATTESVKDNKIANVLNNANADLQKLLG